MCGIAGFFGKGDRSDLDAMTAALAHRGPDGAGHHVDPETGLHLGHRRLSIIDLAGGTQPMWNREGTVGVVYNGEIYNHAELRAELEQAGFVFQSSHSDTEVLVHGYDAWGRDLPRRLNGMFAFAVFDRRRRRLFLARDRFGEKPLYYARDRGFFAFASELSALACHRAVANEPSLPALRKFFAYGYLPGATALYRSTSKLPGGHILEVDLDTAEPRVERYWRFRIEPDEDLARRGEDSLAEELRALLFQAVRRRLISDVPIGMFLSGGIDSSAVVAAAASALPARDIKTFTIGFREPSYDESAHARAVATAMGTEHRERQLDLPAAADSIDAVLGGLDEPLGDPSILPTHMLSAFTREHVTVALSGDGGDELFAGYDPFKALTPARLYAALAPGALHRGLRHLAEALPRSARNMSLDFKLRRSLMGLSYPQAVWNPVWMSALEPELLAELFDSPVSWEEVYAEAIELWESNDKLDLLDRSLEFFTTFYLQDDILTKVDRAAMMSSLESRAVFLDNDLVDFARRLPNRFKYRNGRTKILLRKALEGVLPERILARPKKGFGIPVAEWMKRIPEQPPLTPLAGVNMGWVERAWRDHRAGKADHRLFLWSWLSLQRVIGPGQDRGFVRGAA